MLPAVYAIVNVDSERDPLAYIEHLLLSGAEIIQLRNKRLDFHEFIALAEKALVCRDRFQSHPNRRSFCSVIINDDVDICARLSADGVHLGQEDSSPVLAREKLGNKALLGLSTHTLDQVLAAPISVLSYLALGPIFPSPTKSGHAAEVGLDGLRRVRPHVSLPLVAIGGIDGTNAESVFEAGADSVALISALRNDVSLLSLRPNTNLSSSARSKQILPR